MILCVSGPIDPPPYVEMRDYYNIAFEYIEGQEAPDAIMSGAAYGVDTDSLRVAIIRWPTIPVIFAVPNAPHNASFVAQVADEHRGPVDIHNVMSRDPSVGKRYMARNDWMAEMASALVAFPHRHLEVIRSGTWSTVRRFRKRDKTVYMFPLNWRNENGPNEG